VVCFDPEERRRNGWIARRARISLTGIVQLPFDRDAITGFVVVNAESLEDAQRMAEGNPYVSSIRVYEMASHG
jgi:hypothetical protein